jgi:hypothetical protein
MDIADLSAARIDVLRREIIADAVLALKAKLTALGVKLPTGRVELADVDVARSKVATKTSQCRAWRELACVGSFEQFAKALCIVAGISAVILSKSAALAPSKVASRVVVPSVWRSDSQNALARH